MTKIDGKVTVFCLGHKPPQMNIGLIDHFITHTETGTPKSIVIPNNFIEQMNGRSLSEFLHLFWMLDNAYLLTDKIYICQYRRFNALHEPRAEKASNASFTFVVDQESANKFFPRKSDLSSVIGMFSTVVRPPAGMWAQFAAHHPVEDLENFYDILSSSRILGRSELKRFRSCPYLIPCSSLSMWKIEDFLFTIGILKDAWIHYLSSGLLRKREGYNSRTGGFILERLLSFMLIDGYASPLAESGYRQGYQCTITDEQFIRPTI